MNDPDTPQKKTVVLSDTSQRHVNTENATGFEKQYLAVENIDFSRTTTDGQSPFRPITLERQSLASPLYIENVHLGASEPLSVAVENIETRGPGAILLHEAIKGEYSYGKLGLFLGLTSILGGVILGLHGVTGHTAWTAKLVGLESTITDAPAGVVLFIVGLFMVWATKPKVKLKDIKG